VALIDGGSSTAGKANVDANYNLNVNLPTTATQAGYVQEAYIPTSTISKLARITGAGARYSAEMRQLIDIDFSTISTVWSGKVGTNATTMTKAASGSGFMRLNNSAITTTTTGISMYTCRTLAIEAGYDYKVSASIRHDNGLATNKQAEFGLGYYAFGTGQAAQMNEFIGFRWTTAGNLIGVLGTSAGGAPTEQTVNINSGTPYSNNVARDYEIVFTSRQVEFWVDGVYQAKIDKDVSVFGVIKQQSLPVIARIFNSGAASAAMTFDIADIAAFKIGADDGQVHGARMAAMGKSSYYWQPDLTTGVVHPHNNPASATPPTAATGSNTASVLNATGNMGGFFRMNGASIVAGVHSVIWVAAYLNPAVPTATGGANNARNLFVSSISVSPLVVSTVLAGGGFSALWLATIGCSAITTATNDGDGTTAVATKADRLVPLNRHFTFAAAAAVGTLETGAGDGVVYFNTPLVVHPGEHLKIGIRTTWVNAAVTSGVFDGSINVNGYWD